MVLPSFTVFCFLFVFFRRGMGTREITRCHKKKDERLKKTRKCLNCRLAFPFFSLCVWGRGGGGSTLISFVCGRRLRIVSRDWNATSNLEFQPPTGKTADEWWRRMAFFFSLFLSLLRPLFCRRCSESFQSCHAPLFSCSLMAPLKVGLRWAVATDPIATADFYFRNVFFSSNSIGFAVSSDLLGFGSVSLISFFTFYRKDCYASHID